MCDCRISSEILLTKEKLLSEMLTYSDGTLYWKEWRRGVRRDMVAGSITKNGYVSVGAKGVKTYAHRIVWVMFNGDIPDGVEIDHINHDRADNRIENLRLVSRAENLKNKGVIKSSSGEMGVYWSNAAQKWEAAINVNGKKKYLGLFNSVESAKAARMEANRLYGFHKNHGAT
ncbi:HNH endonuclease [Hafnia phage Pocis76]|uniref:HNH endonuclease n=1 Tax=Hafnia phage Pocis76 TaxID=2831174 RepID=A0A8E7FMI7_9CAUD|nr:HNH endonuclease [Hafnia phage Pocis76]